MNTLERINEKFGATLRGRMGVKKGNEYIRNLAEKVDGVKYPLFGKED